MINEHFSFKSKDNTVIFVYKWMPEGNPKGVVQIAHGMAEHAKRYEGFAKFLTQKGYIVYANDHRGHGKSAGSLEYLGFLAEKDGFDWLVRDFHDLSHIIKESYPGLPLFIFGHSMGSFLVQRYIMLYPGIPQGIILSGSNGKQGIILKFALALAKLEVKKQGRKSKSERLHNLIFGGYNEHFKPNRTRSDWLSRDDEEVDKYINDPYCGTIFTAGFFYDFFKGLLEVENKNNIALIPKDIPIYIFSGDRDPVGNFGKGVMNLYRRYKEHGVKDIEYKLYKDGRHEMLNEINRDEVMNDVTMWLDSHI